MGSNITFLTEEQVFGDNQLDIFKKYGTACAITDFALLLGGRSNHHYPTKEGDSSSWWWTRTRDWSFHKYEDVVTASVGGKRFSSYVSNTEGGARPALPYSSISSITSNVGKNKFGIKEVEYGEYPQTIVDESFSRELEDNFKQRTGIRETGKTYTTSFENYDNGFKLITHAEFEYKGRKYIRFVGDEKGEYRDLSDGRLSASGEIYWVAVEPIKWLVDKRTNIALSKKILFSGIQFKRGEGYNGDFDKTDIKQFIDKYFSNDIMTTPTISYFVSEFEEEEAFKGKKRKAK